MDETGIDRTQWLTLKQVDERLQSQINAGRVKYVEKTLHVVNQSHPIQHCIKTNLLDAFYKDIATSLYTLRQCAFQRTLGKVFHTISMGSSGIDPTTLYVRLMNSFTKQQQELIALVCVAEDEQWTDVELQQLPKLAARIMWVLDESEKRIDKIRDEYRKRKELDPSYE